MLTKQDLDKMIDSCNGTPPYLIRLFKPKNKTVHHLGIFTKPISSYKVKGGHVQTYEV
jgi:hypothetical protein